MDFDRGGQIAQYAIKQDDWLKFVQAHGHPIKSAEGLYRYVCRDGAVVVNDPIGGTLYEPEPENPYSDLHAKREFQLALRDEFVRAFEAIKKVALQGGWIGDAWPSRFIESQPTDIEEQLALLKKLATQCKRKANKLTKQILETPQGAAQAEAEERQAERERNLEESRLQQEAEFRRRRDAIANLSITEA